VRWYGVVLIVLVAVNIVAVSAFAVLEAAKSPQFCALCHNMQRHVDSYLTGDDLDAVHRKANVGCKDCHETTIATQLSEVFRYVTGNYEQVFSKRTFDQSMCTRCHISLEHQAARTDFLVRNPHQSHWPGLQCGECHVSHGEQVDYCSRCHDNGGQRMTGAPIVPRAVNPWAEQ
jgi:cytochrome c nitrite reductase small subunit